MSILNSYSLLPVEFITECNQNGCENSDKSADYECQNSVRHDMWVQLGDLLNVNLISRVYDSSTVSNLLWWLLRWHRRESAQKSSKRFQTLPKRDSPQSTILVCTISNCLWKLRKRPLMDQHPRNEATPSRERPSCQPRRVIKFESERGSGRLFLVSLALLNLFTT